MIFGWGRKSKLIGSTFIRDCGHCDNRSEWQIVKQFNYISVFFAPIIQWKVSWLHLCPVCKHGEAANSSEAQRLLNGDGG